MLESASNNHRGVITYKVGEKLDLSVFDQKLSDDLALITHQGLTPCLLMIFDASFSGFAVEEQAFDAFDLRAGFDSGRAGEHKYNALRKVALVFEQRWLTIWARILEEQIQGELRCYAEQEQAQAMTWLLAKSTLPSVNE